MILANQHTDTVSCLDFSPDSTKLITGSLDKYLLTLINLNLIFLVLLNKTKWISKY